VPEDLLAQQAEMRLGAAVEQDDAAVAIERVEGIDEAVEDRGEAVVGGSEGGAQGWTSRPARR
jgi:hypothetical protein